MYFHCTFLFAHALMYLLVCILLSINMIPHKNARICLSKQNVMRKQNKLWYNINVFIILRKDWNIFSCFTSYIFPEYLYRELCNDFIFKCWNQLQLCIENQIFEFEGNVTKYFSDLGQVIRLIFHRFMFSKRVTITQMHIVN